MAQTLRTGAWWLTWTLGGTLGFIIPFTLAFILIGVITGIFVADVEATLDAPLVFPFILAAAFAAGGAGLGLVQWLHIRKRIATSSAWIASATAGFATLALVHGATLALLGDAVETNTWIRLGDEVVHNAAGGLVAGALQWRFVLARTGTSRRAWVGTNMIAFIAAGTTAWGVGLAAGIPPGDAAPLGMLVMSIILGARYRAMVMRDAIAPDGPHATSA